MIGATTSQTLDLMLLNKGDIVYGTSTIKVEIGLKIGSTVEYIPIGIYNIDDIEKTDYTIKITAYDNMIKFERNFITNLGDTLTLQQVVSELTRITGVQVTGSLPSYAVKKLEGFSCREILSYVASICGGNAIITRDGKFTIVTPKDNSYSIGTANYIDYKREETKYKIGKISCQAGEEVISQGSLGADSMELQFENPWVNATILNDIYTNLNGFEYLGYSMKWQGDPSVDVGDIVTITDKKGVVRKHPILSQKFTYTGGLTSEIGAKGENKNKNEFSSNGPSAKKVERVAMELALINRALIDVAYIGDLTAENIKFDTASGTIMDLQTLLAKFVSGENGQYLNLTTDNVAIANAVIKDTIAANISVQDLKAGNIDANRFNIVGTNGNLLIKDNTIQIKDSTRVRVQIGKDASNDYNMYVWDSTGKLMFDATGLKADGIKSKIIRDDMVSDTANINGSKLNIGSLITEINKDTNTQIIKASKVAIDLTGQSLEVSFNSLKSNVDSKESRNYIRNGNAISNTYFTYLGIAEIEGKKCFYQTHKGSGERYIMTTRYSLEELAGKTVTISFLAKQSSNLNQSEVFILSRKKGSTKDFDYSPVTRFNYNTEKLTQCKLIYTFPSDIDSFYIRWDNNSSSDGLDATLWITDVKLEVGENSNPVYSIADEDREEKIQANTVAIKATQESIATLVKETTIEKDGTTIKLKDAYTTLEQTVSGINSTVASHTSSISSVQATADSKAKVFTSTPTTPYKVGDIWTGGPSGELMKCKVSRASGSYVAADWEKASKYTDDTKANAVEGSLNTLSGKVTTVENNYTSLSQDLSGFKTTVSNTYGTKTELSTVDGKVSSLTTRVNTVEQNITATAITTTISSAINAGTSSISTTQFVMDKNGLTIKNGALTIKNKAGTNVLTGDTNGNLTITGTFINKNSNGVDAIKIDSTNIYFYDWDRNARELGIIYSSNLTDYPNVKGFSMAHNQQGYMTLGYRTGSNSFGSYMTFDKYSINPTYAAPIRIHEGTVFHNAVNMQDRVYIPSILCFEGAYNTTTPQIFKNTNDSRNILCVQVSVNAKDDGFIIKSNTGGTLFGIQAGYSYPVYSNTSMQVYGNFTATGTKARLVNTKSYGGVKLNAIESADAVFEDIGEGITDYNGLCYIYLDSIMQETINTKCNYQVFLQKYSEGDLFVLERNENYFIVKGTPNIKFGWRFIAKQRGYEMERLEQENIIIPEEFYSNIENEKEINYDKLANDYLNNYEMELIEVG